jgi:hypothetical protein
VPRGFRVGTMPWFGSIRKLVPTLVETREEDTE